MGYDAQLASGGFSRETVREYFWGVPENDRALFEDISRGRVFLHTRKYSEGLHEVHGPIPVQGHKSLCVYTA